MQPAEGSSQAHMSLDTDPVKATFKKAMRPAVSLAFILDASGIV